MPPQKIPTTSIVTTRLSESLAIVALVLGIFGLTPGLGVLFAIAAIAIGFISLSKIKKGLAGGYGMALAGVIMGFVGLFFTLLMITLFIVGVTSLFKAASTSPYVPLNTSPNSPMGLPINQQ